MLWREGEISCPALDRTPPFCSGLQVKSQTNAVYLHLQGDPTLVCVGGGATCAFGGMLFPHWHTFLEIILTTCGWEVGKQTYAVAAVIVIGQPSTTLQP